jgi:hypothetical protein
MATLAMTVIRAGELLALTWAWPFSADHRLRADRLRPWTRACGDVTRLGQVLIVSHLAVSTSRFARLAATVPA